MMLNESLWVKNMILGLNFAEGIHVLNFGCQDKMYLKTRPQIEENIIKPTLENNYRLFNFDLLPKEGVDFYGDILEDDIFKELKRYSFSVIYCFNVLEHVEKIEAVCERLESVVRSKGYILVTVPYCYPLHDDPIDNGFRPSPQELALLFGRCKMVQQAIVDEQNYFYYLKKNLSDLIMSFSGKSEEEVMAKKYNQARHLGPLVSIIKLVRLMMYLNRNFKISCVLFRKVWE